MIIDTMTYGELYFLIPVVTDTLPNLFLDLLKFISKFL